MSRWHRRLAELRAEQGAAETDASSAPVYDVQNVRNVQNPAMLPTFEHFEQIEQPHAGPEDAPPTAQAVRTWGETEEERAAIVEEGSVCPRHWAEGYAALCVMPPPCGFSASRWGRIIDAAGRFIDRWAAKAIRDGWSDLDVFGCDPDRPDARFDCMGLLMLLDRHEIVAIDAEGADLVTVTGAHQRFRRRSLPSGTVSLWELAI